MPLRELKYPKQVEDWLRSWGDRLRSQSEHGSLILIGSAAILWHANQKGIQEGFQDASMDVDPITSDECVAVLCYESQMGSAFELERGWHVNLMPEYVLREFDEKWRSRASEATYGALKVIVPSVEDLLGPKIRRGEPRDFRHRDYAILQGLIHAKGSAS